MYKLDCPVCDHFIGLQSFDEQQRICNLAAAKGKAKGLHDTAKQMGTRATNCL